MRTIYENLEKRLTRLKRKKSRKKLLFWLGIQFLAVWSIFQFVIGIAMVEGGSMNPTLVRGDIVIYSKWPSPDLTYEDIVLVSYTDDTAAKNRLIKRIAGMPGDVVEVDEKGYLTRNDKAITEPEALYGYQGTDKWMDFPAVVPEDSFFCMGDNRAISLDSRSSDLGFARKEQVIGKVISIIRLPKS